MPTDHAIQGLHITDHRLTVPVDWSHPDNGDTLSLFYREVSAAQRQDEDLPLLVFLQGGPGGKSPRPTAHGPGWLHEALKHYRVILPDQRGTGRSSRITGDIMAAFHDAEAAADYLACFDAHAVVADLEHLRKTRYQGARWATLGQSYGGFLTLTYLSYAPQGLERCYITGGLPAIEADPDEVYRRTHRRVAAKLDAYLARFPADKDQLDAIADHLLDHDVRLPNGDPFSVRRLQSLGLMLGMGDGAERLHWLLEEAFSDDDRRHLNHHFLVEVMTLTGFDENPLFAAIHENIYARPEGSCDWSAERQRGDIFDETRRPLSLTGEMIYPWMFDDIQALRPFRDAVHRLAQRRLSHPFYDRHQLAANQVPVMALIYFDDMYVDAELSLATAKAIPHLRYWITNEYEHDGLRQDPTVLRRLMSMAEG
ncbi:MULTISPECIES: alpha/beta fold hydrolase [unclassified Halomonas]|uniref:alpha/beta fold hydrolase n=1 Tax=unclassified Halomonas TaxID=2609666 RepID=UPI001C97CE3B|nr:MULTISPECIES: alpha/beta fold hydrolase [unclassified Halomonas]MBY5925028.1 alpha/beta hydrolase [Halomonas sp. DP4Y7-2]MBY6232069.1 alpha/beta hydrolase [Halomonas sp. DP4Y7-1]